MVSVTSRVPHRDSYSGNQFGIEAHRSAAAAIPAAAAGDQAQALSVGQLFSKTSSLGVTRPSPGTVCHSPLRIAAAPKL